MVTTIDVLCERHDLPICEVAQQSGLDVARVEAIVTGRWLPGPSERLALAAVFGVPVDEIDWGHSISPRNVRYHRFGLREDFQ